MEDESSVHFIEDDKEEAAFRLCIRQDISHILNIFLAKRQNDFETFRKCWDELDFVLIHGARLQETPRSWFYNVLFDETLENLFTSENISWKSGIIYLLYLVHYSQPLGAPLFPISLSDRVSSALVKLWETAEKEGLNDVLALLSFLKEDKAFVLVAMTNREAIDTYQKYKSRILEESNPMEAVGDIQKELADLKDALSRSISDLPDDKEISALALAEEMYRVEKLKILPSLMDPQKALLMKEQLGKDFFQARNDFVKHVVSNVAPEGREKDGTINNPIKRKSSPVSLAVEPVKKKKSETSTAPKAVPRVEGTDKTPAPPPTNVMEGAKDMPHIF